MWRRFSVAVLAIGLSGCTSSVSLDKVATEWAPAASIVVLATWYLTSRANRMAARDRHTLDALLKICLDEGYQTHLDVVRSRMYDDNDEEFPPGDEEIRQVPAVLL
jgi:hypothetical protein